MDGAAWDRPASAPEQARWHDGGSARGLCHVRNVEVGGSSPLTSTKTAGRRHVHAYRSALAHRMPIFRYAAVRALPGRAEAAQPRDDARVVFVAVVDASERASESRILDRLVSLGAPRFVPMGHPPQPPQLRLDQP